MTSNHHETCERCTFFAGRNFPSCGNERSPRYGEQLRRHGEEACEEFTPRHDLSDFQAERDEPGAVVTQARRVC